MVDAMFNAQVVKQPLQLRQHVKIVTLKLQIAKLAPMMELFTHAPIVIRLIFCQQISETVTRSHMDAMLQQQLLLVLHVILDSINMELNATINAQQAKLLIQVRILAQIVTSKSRFVTLVLLTEVSTPVRHAKLVTYHQLTI
jgi:hypothetical protein